MATSSRMNWPYPNAGQDPWYEAFESFVEASDASSFAAFENANLFVFGGGPFTFTGILGTVSWTDPLYVTTAATNIPQVVTAPSNTITLADGEVAYVKVVRNTVAPTSLPLLTASALPANDRDSALVIFARFGNVIQFRNGANILDGETKAVFQSSSGTVTSVTAGAGLSGGVITTSGTIALTDTSVAPGVYTNPTVTVDAQGRITAATSGTGPTSLSVVFPIQSTGGLNPILSLGTVDASRGGTGLTSYTVGDIVYASGATTMAKLPSIATGNVLLSGGLGAAPSYGKVGLSTHVSGTLPASNGGTGQSSYTVGDIVYAAGSATLSALADVATGNVLLSGGVGVAPSYGKVGLTTHVDGTLAATNGGTGYASYATGDLLYAANASAFGKLAAAASGNVLLSGATPSWGKVALASAVSGTLPVGNGGTGLATAPSNGQLLIGNGTTYSLATLTAGAGIVLTNGAGTITVATNAVSTNTASTIVTRDASGNFAAGTITATTFSGALSGTATNAINVGVTNDTTTNAVRYPTFVAATSGNDNIEVASTKLTFNPASGVLAATTFSGSGASLTSIPQSGVTNLTTDLAARPTGSGANGQIAYFTGTSTVTSEGGLAWDATNNRLSVGGNSVANLDIYGGVLGSVTGNALELARFGNGTGGNYSFIRVHSQRTANASTWETAPIRIQQRVDGTDMAYLEFSPTGGSYGLAIGVGSSEYLRVLNGGNVGIGTTNPARPLQVGNESGQQIARIAGGSSGTAGGSAVYFGAGASDIFAVGHYSAIMGGAYNDTFTLYAGSGRNTAFLGGGKVGVGVDNPNTTLEVSGVAQSRNFSLGSNSATAEWRKVGTLTLPQNGLTAKVTAYFHAGYNALNTQDCYVEIYFKTSNGVSVDGNGFAGNSWYSAFGLNAHDCTPKWKANAAGVSAATYDLFLNLPVFSLNSHYRVEMTDSGSARWEHSNTAGTDPGAGSSTVCVASASFNITNSSVGIGLVAPGGGYRLHTYGTNPGIAIQNSSTGGGWVDFLNSAGGVRGNVYYDNASNYMTFGTNGAVERLRIASDGNVGVGTSNPGSYRLTTVGPSVGTATGSVSLWPPGTAQGQRSSLSLYSTFQATADNGPRRTADIIAGYNGGAWGTEYLSFGVGGATDSQLVTTERLRVSATGAVSIPSTGSLFVGNSSWTTSGSDINLNTNGSSVIYLRPGGAGSSAWAYEASSIGGYHRWLNGGGGELLGLNTSRLYSAVSVQIPGATTTDNASPGLVLALNDDFLYNTYYLNQYGVGFHIPSGAAGRGTYVSGFYGVDLFTSGTSRIRITQGGNVAIGDINPTSKLYVDGTITIGTGASTYQAGSLGYSDSNWGFVYRPPRAGTAAAHLFESFSGSDLLRINENGNVGIGGVDPGYKMDVGLGALGTGLGNTLLAYRAQATTNNGDTLQTYLYRNTAGGTNWNSADWFIERGIDGTQQGSIEFVGDGGVALSRARVSRVRVPGGASPGAIVENFTNEALRMEGTDPWFSFYQSGTRKGWIGYGAGAGTTTLGFTTETTNGSLAFSAAGLGSHIFNRRLIPTADNSYNLGGPSPERWATVYAVTPSINTSDIREKKDITTSDLGLAFIEALRPVSYRFKVGQNKVETQPDGTDKIIPQPGVRPHYGFLAQEVKATMDALGISDFAGYIHDEKSDTYGLRYSEFIAPTVKAVQELSAENKALKKRVADLEDLFLQMRGELDALKAGGGN